MRTLIYFSIFLLVSCTKKTEINNDNSVRLESSVESDLSRSASSSLLPVGSEIGIFIVESVNMEAIYDGEERYRNIRVVRTIDGWRMDQDVILKSFPGKVLAYYPYKEGTDFSIPLNSEEDKTFLFGQGETEVSESSTKVLIRMQSPFTIARFWLKQSAPGSSVFATELRLRNDPQFTSLCIRGNVGLSTQSINPVLSSPHISVIDDQGYIWFTDKYRNVDFFVFPCRMRTAEIIFEARIDDRYYQYVIPPATWIPGMVNEYYLTFNNN